MKIKILLVLSLLFLSILPCRANTTYYFGCSDKAVSIIKDISYQAYIKGYKTPEYITCDSEYAYKNMWGNDRKSFDNILGLFVSEPDFNIIYVTEKQNEGNFRYSYIHELGHYNNRLNMKRNDFLRTSLDSVPKEYREYISENISDYANTNRPEFVAEIFVRIFYGIKVNPELMDLYRKYGGA